MNKTGWFVQEKEAQISNKSSPDRRIQRTRQLLQDSLIALILEKGYEAITVQDIIDHANVGRSTFYFHYKDKEDLLLSGFDNLRNIFEEFREQLSPDKTTWDFSRALFQHAEENRQVFKALFGIQTGDILLKHVQKNLFAFLHDHFQERWSTNTRVVPIDVFVQYSVNTILGLLTWWLDNDIPYTAVQLNEYYRLLTEPTINQILNV